jgi:hypothetical protein
MLWTLARDLALSVAHLLPAGRAQPRPAQVHRSRMRSGWLWQWQDSYEYLMAGQDRRKRWQ